MSLTSVLEMNAGLRLEFSDKKNQTKKQPYEIFGSPIEKKSRIFCYPVQILYYLWQITCKNDARSETNPWEWRDRGAGRVEMEVQGYSLYIDTDEFAEFKFVLDGMLMLE